MKTYTKPELKLKMFVKEIMMTASSYGGQLTDADKLEAEAKNVVTINYEKLNIVW